MHMADAFHAETALIPVARINGITNAIVAPTSTDTLPGQDSFIQLDGKSADEMLLVRDIALPLNFTGEQRRRESWEKRKYPSTRMGMAAQLRQAFIDARDYEGKIADYDKKKDAAAKATSRNRLLRNVTCGSRRCFPIYTARSRLCWRLKGRAIWRPRCGWRTNSISRLC